MGGIWKHMPSPLGRVPRKGREREYLFRHGFAVPPSPKGKAWALPRRRKSPLP